jgi:antitoxin component HigA of HigAB toxin-antitoxin module
LGDLPGKGKKRTPGETKLMRLLSLPIGDYDRRHAMPPDDSTPAEILQFPMAHSGKTTAELLPVFGQRSHVNEAVNGTRPISADRARKPGRIFSVNPGLFV